MTADVIDFAARKAELAQRPEFKADLRMMIGCGCYHCGHAWQQGAVPEHCVKCHSAAIVATGASMCQAPRA